MTWVQQQPASHQLCTTDGYIAPYSAGSLSGSSQHYPPPQPSPLPDVTGWGCRAAVNMFPGLESALPGLPGAPWLSKAAEEAVSVRGLWHAKPFHTKALRLGDPASRTGPNTIVSLFAPWGLTALASGNMRESAGGPGANTTHPKSCSQVYSSLQ